MDDVFLSEVHLDGNEDWENVGGSDVSFIPATSENETDILAVQIDIASPVSSLKTILGSRLVADLSQYEIWLQDVIQVKKFSLDFFPKYIFNIVCLAK